MPQRTVNQALTLQKASGWEIIKHLYRRYEIDVLYTVVTLTYTLIILNKLGVF